MVVNQSFDSGGFGESLPQQIYKYILQKIIEGKLKAGDKIVEEEIARDLNTSRAPVREALYLLQMDHIVQRLPRRGTVVNTFARHEIVEYNDVMIELIRVSVEYSRDKWTTESTGQLQLYLEEVNQACATHDVLGYQLKAEQLFKHILMVAGNQALAVLYEKANIILKVFAQVEWSVHTMEQFHIEFKNFAEALLRADYEHAKKAIFNTLKLGVI